MARIAFFEDRYTGVAGAQENVLLLGQGLLDAGRSATLITTAEGQLAHEAAARGLEVLIVDAPEPVRHLQRRMLRGLGALGVARDVVSYSRRLAKEIEASDIDLVVASAVRPMLLLVWARLRLRIPIVLFAQNSVPLGLLAVPAVLASSRILLIAEGAINSFPAPLRKIALRRSEVLHSGRDPFVWKRTKPRPADRRPVVLLTLCSIVRRKGVHLLVEAVALLRSSGHDVVLRVVGAPRGPRDYANSIMQRVSEEGLPVEFHDWVDDPRLHLEHADVFVLGSYDEGLPGVLIEAMAYELPCVTTAAGGSGEAVADARSGFVVPVGDAAALAQAIAALIEDPGMRDAMGRAGRQRFEERFTVSRFQEQFLAVVDGLLDCAKFGAGPG